MTATRSVLGLPSGIEPRESNDRFYFIQEEPGLDYPVHQMGVSSGTLRILALMTALLAEPESNLIGIEEPENYVHPTALRDFAQHLLQAKDRVQFVVTTHSPLLLDFLDDPAAVRVVQRSQDNGTTVLEREIPMGSGRLWTSPDSASASTTRRGASALSCEEARVVSPLQEELSRRVSNVGAKLLFAYARQHLEAWYFADAENLRQWLGGRSLGSVDASSPDAIQDPKRHLSNLLGDRVYTARTSEDIARRLDPRVIEQRSPSFKGLVEAVRNGGDASA
ncbi:MAG: DUF4276 family protein [Acidobacteriota bacterium]|nr:DUF4276 family protein [Acidobacteriota bacterium]